MSADQVFENARDALEDDHEVGVDSLEIDPGRIADAERLTDSPAPISSSFTKLSSTNRSVVPVVFSDFQRVQVWPSIPQEQLLPFHEHVAWLARCANEKASSSEEREAVRLDMKERYHRSGVSVRHIRQRQLGIVTPDFKPCDPSDSWALPKTYGNIQSSPAGNTWDKRLKLFEEAARVVFKQWYDAEATPPDEIVHVSCAGYVSPSPAQTYLSKRGWLRTGVTHSYSMGCYGAFPGVRTALGLIASSYTTLPKPKSRVDVCHTEFLTLHMNFLDDSAGNIVTNTLFGDGFIKYSASALSDFSQQGKNGLSVLAMQEWLAPDTAAEMTLRPGPYQHDMFLARSVPIQIRNSIREFVTTLCAQVGIDFEKEKANLTYAIHPGGTAILNHIRDRLGIAESKLRISREVLLEHGNMASATAPHVWKAIVESDSVPVGAKVLSVAFGPGLTLIGALFEKV